MSPLETQFFTLLRSGLRGGVPDPALFPPETDWEGLYRLAHDQTVVCLVTDGIHALPQECLPAEEERLDPFLGDLMYTERRNGQLNSVLPKLQKVLDGLRVVIVKGQPLAMNYPNPLRRQPGDIDLLLPPSDYARAREILLPKASRVEPEDESILHQGMFFGNVEVELHGTISTLMSRAWDRQLNDLMDRMFREGGTIREVAGMPVRVPGVHFDAVYIFVHFLHHYWSGGCGLRQLIDWMFFLESHSGELDMSRLRSDLEELGLVRLWHAFLVFARDYLGMNEAAIKSLSWKKLPSGWRNARIWRFIRRSGNFGKIKDRKRGEESYLVRKIHSFWRLVVCDRLRHFISFPLESLRFFFGAFGYGLGRLAKGE